MNDRTTNVDHMVIIIIMIIVSMVEVEVGVGRGGRATTPWTPTPC